MGFKFNISDNDGDFDSDNQRKQGYDESAANSGILKISGLILYVIGLIGVCAMFTSAPLVFSVITLALYLFPIPFFFIGGRSLKRMLSIISKNAYLAFNLFIEMWWVLFFFGDAPYPLLIVLSIVCFYSIYYFFVVIINNAVKNSSKLAAILPLTAGVVLGVAAMLLFNNFEFLNMIFCTAITVCGTISILILKIISRYSNGKKVKDWAFSLAVYLLACAVIPFICTMKVEHDREQAYQSGIELISSKDYAAARETLGALIGYKDSYEKYNEIKFKDLKVGDKIYHGICKENATVWDPEIDAYLPWTVVSAKDGRALLLCDMFLTFTKENAEDYLQGDDFISRMLGSQKAYDAALPVTVDGVSLRYFTLSKEEVEALLESDPSLKDVMNFSMRSNIAKDFISNSDYNGYLDGWGLRGLTEKGEKEIVCYDGFERGSADKPYGIRPVFVVNTD